MNLSSGIDLRASKPYSAADKNGVHIDYGTQVEVLGSVKNHWNHEWYKVSYNGKTGYTSINNVTFVGYGAQSITGSITSPYEGQILPKKAYPVKGTITSKYPIETVEAYIDGELYATVPGDGKTSLELQPTDANMLLDFAALAPGSHTIVIKARDIHHTGYVTVCTRKFVTEGTTTCSHSYSSSITTEATCTDEGVRTYKCSKCGTSYTESIPTVSHDYGDWWLAVEPTCVKRGSYYRQCSYCNLIDAKSGDALGHDWGDVQIEYPTCVSEGKEYKVCSRCNAEDVLSTTPTNNSHAIGPVVIEKTATCISSGVAYSPCVSCGYKMPYDLPADPEAHRWEELITEQPTCATPGELQRCCHECEKFEKIEIPATGEHDWGEWYVETNYGNSTTIVRRDCKKCLEYVENSVINVLFSYPVTGGNIYLDKENGTVLYSDNTVSDVEIPSHIDGVQIKAIAKNAFSDSAYLTKVIVPAGVETIGENAFLQCTALSEVVLPDTLTSIGQNAFENCYVLDSISIPSGVETIENSTFSGCVALTNVTMEYGVVSIGEYAFNHCRKLDGLLLPNSITNIGSNSFASCWSLNHVYYSGSEDDWNNIQIADDSGLNKVTIHFSAETDCDHVYGDWNTEVFANCGYAGVERRWCLYCDVYQDRVISPTGEHKWDWWSFEGDFCENDTVKSRRCLNCGMIESEVVTATGHDWEEWYALSPVDCENNGTEGRACRRCEKYETRIVPATGHSMSEWVVMLDPNCTKEGREERNCVICYDYIEKRPVSINDNHNWGPWYTSKSPDIDIEGENRRDCYRCGEFEIEKVPALEETVCSHVWGEWVITKQPTDNEVGAKMRWCTKCNESEIAEIAALGSTSQIVAYPVVGGNIYFEKATGEVVDSDESITEADIPSVIEGVKVVSIGNRAFEDCCYLKKLTMSEGIMSVGEFAFVVCSSLTSITIPESVISIGEWAFGECTSLTSITIPDGITSIGNSAFGYCSSLASIDVNAGNNFYSDIDGVLFNKAQTELICCPEGKNGSYTIPDGITSIRDRAFWDCKALTSINIPNSVMSIGDEAFAGCNFLTSIVIPDGITNIGEMTFYYCVSLTSATIPDSVKNIGDKAFDNCISLTIYFKGSKDKWSEVHIGEQSIPSNTTIVFTDFRTNPFTDVKDNQWYTEGILWCYHSGYMAGVSDTEFGRKTNVTRAMFATILAKIDGGDISAYSEMSFSDVKPGQWYSNAIEWAASNGYAAGIGSGQFGRKANVSREQIAMFFYTYSEKNGINVSDRADLTVFEDNGRIHGYAMDAISWAVAKGLISGTSDTTLSPRDSATRAEIALVIKNYVENVKK